MLGCSTALQEAAQRAQRRQLGLPKLSQKHHTATFLSEAFKAGLTGPIMHPCQPLLVGSKDSRHLSLLSAIMSKGHTCCRKLHSGPSVASWASSAFCLLQRHSSSYKQDRPNWPQHACWLPSLTVSTSNIQIGLYHNVKLRPYLLQKAAQRTQHC